MSVNSCIAYAAFSTSLTGLSSATKLSIDEGMCGRSTVRQPVRRGSSASMPLLNENKISTDGAILLANAIRANTGTMLRDLKLNDNKIGPDAEADLAAMLSTDKLTALSLRGNGLIGEELATGLKSNENFVFLDAWPYDSNRTTLKTVVIKIKMHD